MRVLVLGVALLTGLGCASRPARDWVTLAPASGGLTVIRDVAVFLDAERGSISGRDVWIEGERIARVVPTGTIAHAPGALVIDGAGRTLLPGLIDVHVHVLGGDALPWAPALPDPEQNLEKFLYAGITTVLDLAGLEKDLAELRESIDAGDLAGPDIHYSGRMITARGGHPAAMIELFAPWPVSWWIKRVTVFEVSSTQDVDAALARLEAADVEWLKLVVDDIPLEVPKLSAALIEHAVRGARSRGMPVAAHIGSDADARLAVQQGVDLLAHGAYRDAYTEQTLALLHERDVAVQVTLGVFRNVDRVFNGGFEAVPYLKELQGVPDAELAAGPGDWSVEGLASWSQALHQGSQHLLPNAKALGEHGIRWLVGSDSPNVGWSPGQALHIEMEWLVEAGYTPAQVLEAVTARNAQVLGLDDRGRVAEGLRADLLLVEGDPTARIADVHRIEEVFRAGRRVERAAISDRSE